VPPQFATAIACFLIVYSEGAKLLGDAEPSVHWFLWKSTLLEQAVSPGEGVPLTDSYTYDAFGEIRASSGLTVNAFRYFGGQGYYYDPDLQQLYLRAHH
jgi:hypothetical protein